jgi:hypothetical protein
MIFPVSCSGKIDRLECGELCTDVGFVSILACSGGSRSGEATKTGSNKKIELNSLVN